MEPFAAANGDPIAAGGRAAQVWRDALRALLVAPALANKDETLDAHEKDDEDVYNAPGWPERRGANNTLIVAATTVNVPLALRAHVSVHPPPHPESAGWAPGHVLACVEKAISDNVSWNADGLLVRIVPADTRVSRAHACPIGHDVRASYRPMQRIIGGCMNHGHHIAWSPDEYVTIAGLLHGTRDVKRQKTMAVVAYLQCAIKYVMSVLVAAAPAAADNIANVAEGVAAAISYALSHKLDRNVVYWHSTALKVTGAGVNRVRHIKTLSDLGSVNRDIKKSVDALTNASWFGRWFGKGSDAIVAVMDVPVVVGDAGDYAERIAAPAGGGALEVLARAAAFVLAEWQFAKAKPAWTYKREIPAAFLDAVKLDAPIDSMDGFIAHFAPNKTPNINAIAAMSLNVSAGPVLLCFETQTGADIEAHALFVSPDTTRR